MSAPTPYRPPMNWEERARRAEALLEIAAKPLQAYAALPCEYPRGAAGLHCSMIPRGSNLKPCASCAIRAALDCWEAHKADLAILDQQEPRP